MTNSETNPAGDPRTDQIERIVQEFLADSAMNEDAILQQYPELMPELGRQLKICGMVRAAQDKTLDNSETIEHLSLESEYLTQAFEPVTNNLVASSQRVQLAEPGHPFGHYRLHGKLGKGGMGTVFEAEDTNSGQRVALKLLTRSFESSDARQRFVREGRLAASINHPNSVYVYGTEEIDGIPVISMERMAGGTFNDLVKRDGPLLANSEMAELECTAT